MGLRNLYKVHRSLILRSASLTTLFVVWELMGQLGFIDLLFFSWPSAIIREVYEILMSGKLSFHLSVSLFELACGFSLAFATAVPLGLVLGRSKTAEDLLDPLISAMHAMPRIALMPLIILMFGIGLQSKVALVFFGTFFPIVINSHRGSKEVKPLLIDVARIFGARGIALYTKIILPYMVPYLVAGLRLGLGIGLIMVVVGEFLAATRGVGYMISYEASMYNTNAVLAWTLVISVISIFFTEGIRYFERRIFPVRKGVT